MVCRRISILAVLFLFTLCAAVIAEDSSGNISVQVTRLDDTYSYVIYVVVGVVVGLALLFSTMLLLRRRPRAGQAQMTAARPAGPVRRGAEGIVLTAGSDTVVRHEGYYSAVFSSPKPDVELADEKDSSPAVQNIDAVGVERYLKEDERIVLNVLRMKHNSCSQATLRVVTDFSKAKLSRILTELEERGIIYKEQQGRKNMITLRT